MASAIDESMLQCTEPSDFSSMITCGLQPLLEFGDGSSARGWQRPTFESARRRSPVGDL
jgi:hypothetical protein